MATTHPSLMNPSLLNQLLEAARWAPSPDNNQPWAFGVTEDEIRVYHKRERALPSDVRDFFSWIGVGAAIENIVLAASLHNLRAEVSYQARPFPVDPGGELIACISLQQGGFSDSLSMEIEKRVTNRRPYKRDMLSESECQSLAGVITDTDCRVLWLTEKSKIRQFAKLAAEADRIRFEHRPFHEEFHKVLRYSEKEVQQTSDGLDLRTLELPPLARTLFRFLKPWNRMRIANRFGMSRVFANASKNLVVQSGAVGFLATADDTDRGFLQAGRMFQRVWLKVTQANLAFQPLGGLPLFLTKMDVEGLNSFQSHHLKTLQSVIEPFRKLFLDVDGYAPVMMFRVGHAPPPTARSIRYPLERILSLGDGKDAK